MGESLHLARDRNRAAILALEMFWGLSIPFVYHATVIPGYLRHLGLDPGWIGLVPALFQGVLAVVQPLSAYAVQAGPGRVRAMCVSYGLGVGGYLPLGLLVLFIPVSPPIGYMAALAVVSLFALGIGLGDPQYMEVTVAAVPAELRGRFFGLRAVFLGIGGIAGGALAERALRAWPPPANFAACFILGGFLCAASLLPMLAYRYPGAGGETTRSGFGTFVRNRIVPQVRERDFRPYLVAVVFFALAASGFPFLSLVLKQRLHEGDSLFGLLGGVFMGCNLGMSWLLGAVCDRWGSRWGFALTLATYSIGVLGCLFLHGRLTLLVCYFMASVWLPGHMVAVTDLALRLASRSSPSEVTAIMMLAEAPARLAGPILVGVAAGLWTYPPALLACVACACGSLLALAVSSRIRPAARSA